MGKDTQQIELPDNLIDLLKLTVSDARKCQADDRYIMYMGTWHRPVCAYDMTDIIKSKDVGKCFVCMAGGIIAQTFKQPITDSISPSDFGDDNYLKLDLIDDIRIGNWDTVNFHLLGWEILDPERIVEYTSFDLEDGNLDEWERLIKALEDSGYGK